MKKKYVITTVFAAYLTNGTQKGSNFNDLVNGMVNLLNDDYEIVSAVPLSCRDAAGVQYVLAKYIPEKEENGK